MSVGTEALLLAIRARGVESSDLRDAAHEACHALQWGLTKKWTRTNVERANPNKRRISLGLADEITARAVEQIVCKRLGDECQTVESCVMTMCMETVKFDRVSLPYDDMVKAVRRRITSPAAIAMADRVLALAETP